MSATVLEVAKNAAQASQTAGEAREKAAAGATVVRRAVDGIVQAREKAAALSRDMSRFQALLSAGYAARPGELPPEQTGPPGAPA